MVGMQYVTLKWYYFDLTYSKCSWQLTNRAALFIILFFVQQRMHQTTLQLTTQAIHLASSLRNRPSSMMQKRVIA